MADLASRLKALSSQRFYKYGLPFLVFVLGGSFGLREFSKLRYEFRKQNPVNPDEAEKYGVKMKQPGEVTLESEYEKIKQLDIDNWSNIRGPRPWEENEEWEAAKKTANK